MNRQEKLKIWLPIVKSIASRMEIQVKEYKDGTAPTYMQKCSVCNKQFFGHKHDFDCGQHKEKLN